VSGCVALFVVVMVFSLKRLFRQGAEKAERQLMALLGQPEVLLRDEMANCFGVTSRGVTQLRGNGVLLLTRDVLAFQPWFRDAPIVIERSRITAAKSARSQLGKTIGRDLLMVEFTEDRPDSVAWYVRALPPWLKTLG
jgi:hypothetical protein